MSKLAFRRCERLAGNLEIRNWLLRVDKEQNQQHYVVRYETADIDRITKQLGQADRFNQKIVAMAKITPEQIGEVLAKQQEAIMTYLQVILQLEKLREIASIKLQITARLIEAYRNLGNLALESDAFLFGRWACDRLDKLSEGHQGKTLLANLQKREQEWQAQLQAPAVSKNQRCPLGLGTCIDHWNTAIAKASKDARLYYQRGLAYSRHGEFAKAIADFSWVLQSDKLDAHTYYERGNAYYHRKEYQKALDDYNRAIAINKNYAQAYNARGIIHSIRNDTIAAVRDFEDATRFKSNMAEAFLNRAAEITDMMMRQRLFTSANLLFLNSAIHGNCQISPKGRLLMNMQLSIMKRYGGGMGGKDGQFDAEKLKKLLEIFGGK